jgi:hypothetical protein
MNFQLEVEADRVNVKNKKKDLGCDQRVEFVKFTSLTDERFLFIELKESILIISGVNVKSPKLVKVFSLKLSKIFQNDDQLMLRLAVAYWLTSQCRTRQLECCYRWLVAMAWCPSSSQLPNDVGR